MHQFVSWLPFLHENVRKYERMVTMSMILLPLALILEALSSLLGGLL